MNSDDGVNDYVPHAGSSADPDDSMHIDAIVKHLDNVESDSEGGHGYSRENEIFLKIPLEMLNG